MALWPVRPLGRQGGEVDRGSKGAKGEVGLAKGSPFHPTRPGLVRCNDFKDASKAAPLLPSSRSGVRTPDYVWLLRIPWAPLQPLGRLGPLRPIGYRLIAKVYQWLAGVCGA